MTFDPLLKPNREIKIWTAAMPYGTPPDPDDWELIFHGYLGDSIRTEGDIVEIECRDLAKRLQERIITTPRTWHGAPIDDGGVRADIVMQQILMRSSGRGDRPYVPDIPPLHALPLPWNSSRCGMRCRTSQRVRLVRGLPLLCAG